MAWQRLITLEQLEHVVATNAKKRFEFNHDHTKIRASQGHSVVIDLAYDAIIPPGTLYHGTATRFIESIEKDGLLKMNRHHVHLSEETIITIEVAKRHGIPILLEIQSRQMHRDGHLFYRSANNVWLTEQVPVEYILFPNP